MTVSKRLAELGITLPAALSALGSYVPAMRTGNLIFTSGQLPLTDGRITVTGRVGAELDVGAARQAARTSVIAALGAAATLADLDLVTRVVKVTVYVAATPGFTEQPTVANGASELLTDVFGAPGQHARSAVGVASLPLGAPVEVELVLELAENPPATRR